MSYEIVRTAFKEVKPSVAVIVELLDVLTALVLIVNVVEVLPVGTVTLLGTATELKLLVRPMTRPPAGAAVAMLMVPVLVFPPVTAVGLRLSAERGGGFTVSEAVFEPPLSLAVTVTTF